MHAFVLDDNEANSNVANDTTDKDDHVKKRNGKQNGPANPLWTKNLKQKKIVKYVKL